ncbi:probable proline--tRNA ligase, mitochondrial [Ixodes scapularis]|uniref:probable proline--tRNA ligase, mitochondrial n=1 Tax=Ixodes scapularis TaxID=6945 RepID=UPI001C38EC51|nr:probable proline--tRNA ligase, mitochondrial [Ixodes scapularis]
MVCPRTTMLLRRFVKLSRHLSSRANVENFARCSRLFQPNSFTKLDAKQGLCKSQKLMLDYGLISPSGTGTFVLLPLATKSLERLVDLIDSELQSVGGQKILLPCLVPGSLFKKTGRWEDMGDELFKLKDRRDHDYCLGPTHEEAVSQLLASLPSLSLRCLPILLYQISPKFRDEGRPKFGLLRGREFIMKDMYSFDRSAESAAETYDIVCTAYSRILERLGVPFVKVKASSGAMGGNYSHEFHFLSNIGEDRLFVCPKCHIGVSADKVESETENQPCDQCSTPLEEERGVEVAHAFSLGTVYSDPLKASFMDSDGKNKALVMNCFGIGVTRLLAASLEVLSTQSELRWPLAIAPFKVAVVTPKKGSHEEEVGLPLSLHLTSCLSSQDILAGDVLLDDRDSWTIGKRLKDLDHMGVPFVVVAGKRSAEAMPLFELHDVYRGSVTEVTQSELLHFFQHGKFREKIGDHL